MPRRNEIIDFDEIAGGPRQSRRERLGMNFLSPFHTPYAAARVARRHTWESSTAMLFDEVEGWRRCAVSTSRARREVEAFSGTGIAPDDRTSRRQRRVARRATLHL